MRSAYAPEVATEDKDVVSAFVPINVAVDVAKLGSLFNAAANSLSVSNVVGAESTKFATFSLMVASREVPSAVEIPTNSIFPDSGLYL